MDGAVPPLPQYVSTARYLLLRTGTTLPLLYLLPCFMEWSKETA